MCSLKLNNFKDCIGDCKKALELDETFLKARLRWGAALIGLGEFIPAREQFKIVLEKEKENSNALEQMELITVLEANLKKGLELVKEKEWAAALKAFREVIEQSPQNLQAQVGMAQALLNLKQYSSATAIARQALYMDPNNSMALYVSGTCYYYSGNTDTAKKVFIQILKLDPDFKLARAALNLLKAGLKAKEEGNEKFKVRDYQAAYDLYTKALEVDPDNNALNAMLYCNRAAAGSKLKKTSESIMDCTRAIQIDSTYLKAYVRRARLYSEVEDYESAVRDLEKAAEIDETPEIRRELRQAKMELKKSKRKNWYKILGVEKTATVVEIKKAYRKAALRYHPDTLVGQPEEKVKAAQAKFQEVSEAHEILTDRKSVV